MAVLTYDDSQRKITITDLTDSEPCVAFVANNEAPTDWDGFVTMGKENTNINGKDGYLVCPNLSEFFISKYGRYVLVENQTTISSIVCEEAPKLHVDYVSGTTDNAKFTEILNRMLQRVPEGFDKREGSVIYDALAPCARELSTMYGEITTYLDNTFAGTADREWLIKRGQEIGITPNEATYAVRKAEFLPTTVDVAIGERFSFDNSAFFTVTEKLEEAGIYQVTCETAGEIGNSGTGRLLPVQYINGLESANLLADVVVYGEEEEDTEAFRQRYFDTLPTMSLDGNVAQYSKWCREYEGIGNYKIFPEWNGKNTVKVSILSSENTLASAELIEEFQTYLDPNDSAIDDDKEATDYPQGRGVGMGKAPIGAIVTVSTAKERSIKVWAMITLKEGYEQPVGLEDEIKEYLKSLNYTRNLISYVAISALIQNNVSIDTVLDVTLNDTKENVTLNDEEIAKLSSFTYEAV